MFNNPSACDYELSNKKRREVGNSGEFLTLLYCIKWQISEVKGEWQFLSFCFHHQYLLFLYCVETEGQQNTPLDTGY